MLEPMKLSHARGAPSFGRVPLGRADPAEALPIPLSELNRLKALLGCALYFL